MLGGREREREIESERERDGVGSWGLPVLVAGVCHAWMLQFF